MTGTIIENMSGRKLAIIVTFLLLCQLACFLIGGLVAPTPANALTMLATICKDTSMDKKDTNKWFYQQGVGSCTTLDLANENHGFTESNIVFTFQMPTARDKMLLDYSRWQQNLIGVIQLETAYHSMMEIRPHSTITIDARLAYRNKGDPEDQWKLYAQSIEQRTLDCAINLRHPDQLYNCSALPLFELGSLFHDYYLLNIRLPVDTPTMNSNIGHILDMWLTVINQNGGFTKVWLSIKTVFFPFIIGILVWFWRRIHMLQRKPVLLEKMLLSLGFALCILNIPIEYLTLHFDLPFMLLLGDMRQGFFYAMLFSFWLVFAGEHMVIQDITTQSTLKQYWKHLSAVGIGCTSLFIFDICERGVQLRNPFYTIWVAELGKKIALTFIILAGISTSVYFLFLTYMIGQVLMNMMNKTQALPSMCTIRRLRYEGIMYRFKFLMVTTVICCAMTVSGYIVGQVAEGKWKWDEHIQIEYTSAFFIGIYGMWNLYIFALLVLYAPSHKRWPVTQNTEDTQNLSDEIEFSPLPSTSSEISSLTSFIRKTTID